MRSKLVQITLLVALGLFLVPLAHGQTDVTIPQLNQVPLDSLLLMDAQQSTAGTKLDDTQYVITNDTVRVTGVVLVKPRILTYTLARYNIFLQDTTTGQVFAGLNVLTNDTSATAQGTGITALDSGDVVTVVGRALEFGSQPNSLTEMYIYSASSPIYITPPPISIVRSGPRPAPAEVTVDSFAVGTIPMPSRGEKYEGMYVVVRNVTVNTVDLASGRFTFVDASGNEMTMYDGSGYYTLRGHKTSGSKYTPPPVGTQLSYIRGVILPQSSPGTAGAYNIMPLYPGKDQLSSSTYAGDIAVGQYAPSITSLVRTPQVPKSTDAVVVTYKAKDLNAGGGIDSSALYYKVGTSGSWVRVKATATSGDSLYSVTIPASANDSLVSYYATAYAVGALTGSIPDPSVPFFYRIRNAGLSVFDIQYTPYVNGLSGFGDDTVTVSGVITADTSDIKETSSGRPRLYMAGAAGAWNGVTIYGASAGVGVDTLARGDSISVTGVARDRFSKTEIQVLTINSLSNNAQVPAAAVVSLTSFPFLTYSLSNPPVDGNPTHEQWEGVLVQFNNVYITQRNADNATGGAGSNFGEYFIGTSPTTSFGLRVDDNGTHRFFADTSASYTAKPANSELIPLGAKLASLSGIFDYSFSFYKLEPRKDDDFGIITGVYQVPNVLPGTYSLEQNYPNPFNPSTTIRYSIPRTSNVTLRIYNLLGQVVQTLVSTEQGPGSYVVDFNASRLASGLYFYRLETQEFTMSKKMLLLK